MKKVISSKCLLLFASILPLLIMNSCLRKSYCCSIKTWVYSYYCHIGTDTIKVIGTVLDEATLDMIKDSVNNYRLAGYSVDSLYVGEQHPCWQVGKECKAGYERDGYKCEVCDRSYQSGCPGGTCP
jgi:hypothetical protein